METSLRGVVVNVSGHEPSRAHTDAAGNLSSHNDGWFAEPSLGLEWHGDFDVSLTSAFMARLVQPGLRRDPVGEANVQLSFHENQTATIDNVECVKVETDIDYFKDAAAHTILEVLPNFFTGGDTDPRKVYVLRWIAGLRAGIPEFNPPYTIVAS